VAKVILKQFDIPKAKNSEILDDAAKALADLAKDLDIEEINEQETWESTDEEDDQPLDVWIDFQDGLTDEEIKELEASLQPVKFMLVKVC
jgi:uncharacterized protein related to proFAR isomerase